MADEPQRCHECGVECSRPSGMCCGCWDDVVALKDMKSDFAKSAVADIHKMLKAKWEQADDLDV